MRAHRNLPSLRWPRGRAALQECIRIHNAVHEDRFRVTDHSIQGDHIHLICEGTNAGAISRGMQGLTIRFSKRLNRVWGRKRGSVFGSDRYYRRDLKTPREVRNALAYLYNNARKHGRRYSQDRADPCSSGPHFDGWRRKPANWEGPGGSISARPRTYLRRVLWRRRGLVDPAEVPGKKSRAP